MAIYYSAAGRSHSRLVSKTDKYLSVGCTMLRQKDEVPNRTHDCQIWKSIGFSVHVLSAVLSFCRIVEE